MRRSGFCMSMLIATCAKPTRGSSSRTPPSCIMYCAMYHRSPVSCRWVCVISPNRKPRWPKYRNALSHSRISHWPKAAFCGETWDTQCCRIVETLPEEVYVSFDIDGLSFENCPHTGTPVSGGLGFNQAVWLLRTLMRSGRRIIGFDLVEVCPAPEDRLDAITGARMLWKLCGATLSRGAHDSADDSR